MTMMAEGWKGLMWFVTGVAVALGLLLVPLEVAAQRKQLDKTLADVAETERDIRSLQTEFDTRANLAQLEKWNGDTLGLSAPTPQQYVSDERALASIDVHAAPAPGQPGIQTAALIIPTIPGVMPTHVQPSDNTPSSVVTAPAQVIAASAPVAVAAQRADVIHAAPAIAHVAVAQAHPVMVAARKADSGRVAAAIAHVTVAHARPVLVASQNTGASRVAAAVAHASAPRAKPQAVAMLDRNKLLSDSTMGSILTNARAEARIH